MSRQPESFPWLNKEKGIKYSNALFCMCRNQIGSQRGTSPVLLWAPTTNVFNYDLGPRRALKGNHQSIFDRHGYKNREGGRLKLTSHQARHLISTLASRGGLEPETLAKWAGRADLKQNRIYNHVSEWEMVAKAEALDTALTLFGPTGQVSQHDPASIQEINLMERGAVHVTLWGMCSHDFIMSPCQKFRDCLNCAEHLCIKGLGASNADKLARIKTQLAQVERDYAAAECAVKSGHSGADRWLEYHQRTVTRLRQLVDILESPRTPEGAQIRLRGGNDFSHLRRAIRAKEAKALAENTLDANLLVEISNHLGSDNG